MVGFAEIADMPVNDGKAGDLRFFLRLRRPRHFAYMSIHIEDCVVDKWATSTKASRCRGQSLVDGETGREAQPSQEA
jgi:hypothetical protein